MMLTAHSERRELLIRQRLPTLMVQLAAEGGSYSMCGQVADGRAIHDAMSVFSSEAAAQRYLAAISRDVDVAGYETVELGYAGLVEFLEPNGPEQPPFVGYVLIDLESNAVGLSVLAVPARDVRSAVDRAGSGERGSQLPIRADRSVGCKNCGEFARVEKFFLAEFF